MPKRKKGSMTVREAGQKGGQVRADDFDVRSGALGRKGARARWNKDKQEGFGIFGDDDDSLI